MPQKGRCKGHLFGDGHRWGHDNFSSVIQYFNETYFKIAVRERNLDKNEETLVLICS